LPNRFWASSLTLAALVLSGCAAESGEVADDAVLRVYVSLPLSGPSANAGQDVADAAELALADAGGEAGGLSVEAVVRDDTEGEGDSAGWTPVAAAANAREAISDSTAIAYLGEFESGATRASLPITNEGRMLQVSPASGAGDLVSDFINSDKPSKFQPGEDRTFGRVIPSDFAQGEAAAVWAEELEVGDAGVLSSKSDFAQTLATGFEGEAGDRGLAIEDPTGSQLRYLAGEGQYFLGLDIAPPLISGEPQIQLGSDALLEPGVPERLARYDGPYLATSAALDPTALPPAGRDFVAAFRAEYGREPGRYAAYGYEAMAVILDSIDRAANPADRPTVSAAFFETADRDSILGNYSIDAVGDTTLDRMSGYELRAGRARVAAELSLP